MPNTKGAVWTDPDTFLAIARFRKLLLIVGQHRKKVLIRSWLEHGTTIWKIPR